MLMGVSFDTLQLDVLMVAHNCQPSSKDQAHHTTLTPQALHRCKKNVFTFFFYFGHVFNVFYFPDVFLNYF